MPKRIAVIATKPEFAKIRKMCRKLLITVESSTEDYFKAEWLCLYRLDSLKNNFINAYEWDGYLEAIAWENLMRDPCAELIQCVERMEVMEVPMWSPAKLYREVLDLSLPF